MTLRGNLFIKMFIAFWLVTVAILGTWMVSSEYFESQPPPEAFSNRKTSGAPHRFLLPIIYNLQNLEEGSLAIAIDDVRKKHEIGRAHV